MQLEGLPVLVLLALLVITLTEASAQSNADTLDPRLIKESTSNISTLETGRGKIHKQKKLLKLIYPIIVAVFAIKSIVMPMMIKVLTALSTSSFVMSKMAFILSIIMITKWIFGSSSERNVAKTRLEVYQIPHRKHVGWETREKNIKYIPLRNEEFDNSLDVSNNKQRPFL